MVEYDLFHSILHSEERRRRSEKCSIQSSFELLSANGKCPKSRLNENRNTKGISYVHVQSYVAIIVVLPKRSKNGERCYTSTFL